ncbi:sliding clamp DNA polymerase accessory protein [Erwinia phage FBB1]|nr:sliding clamp DNA polymerase accessory protein [Erwinia phage FBB1]
MKFSKDTLNILKNFSTINSSIMLKKGSFVMTRTVNATSYAEATISDTIDFDVAIYDLPGFLSILALVGEGADISMAKDGNICIKDARSTIFWPAADPSTISYPNKNITFPTASVIFELKGEDMQQLMRVSRSSSMQIDTLCVTNKDGKIIINGYNKSADSANMRELYSLIVADYDGTNNFSFFINMANMKMQPADYKVMIATAAGNKGAFKFEGSNASYIIAFEQDSNHDF